MQAPLPRSCNVQPLTGVVALCTVRIVQRAKDRAAIVQPTLHDRDQSAGPFKESPDRPPGTGERETPSIS
jgi:hypothetical protein